MKLEQIDHVALHCSDPERTREWYVSTLGFEHVYQGRWSGVPIFLRLGSTSIALFPRQRSDQAGKDKTVSHLALRAATMRDFQSAQAELKSKGVAFEFEDHGISHSVYFTDPDGFHLEITTYDLPA